MAATDEVLKRWGIELPPGERTPLVDRLLEVILQQAELIDQLRRELDRVKGLPEKPRRRPLPSSGLDQPEKPSEQAQKKRQRRRGKRPGSAKRQKTKALPVTDTVELPVEDVPAGANFLGYCDYYVQELKITAEHVRYRRARWRLPDGTFRTAELPEAVRRNGHFGPELRAHVLYQHFQNHVTQPLILEELRERGFDISAGQINEMLTVGHDAFHAEKEGLLPAAREVSTYFQTDDTPTRHAGQNAYANHLGNELFASFTTVPTKSRLDFLKVLTADYGEYVLGGDSFAYMEHLGLPQYVQQLLEEAAEGSEWIYESEADWQQQLDTCGITGVDHRRGATEAALFGCLMLHGLYTRQPLLSDDAGQFDVLAMLHGHCWLHAGRHVKGLIPVNRRQEKAQEQVLDQLWDYYRRLGAYRQAPTPAQKERLKKDFGRLCRPRKDWPALNEVLQRMRARRETLLLVLEHPQLPLHNNGSEGDLREWAKKRKISAGTRGELGRRCRDTFLSLKKTCRKLTVSFLHLLRDRLHGHHQIPPLPDLIRARAAPA